MPVELVHKELSYKITGVLYSVFNELGPGLKEATYERAVAVGLTHAGLKYQRQVYAPIMYQHEQVGSQYFDLFVDDKIILELKVGEYFNRRNIEQILEYLKYHDLRLGLLANFTRKGVQIKRVVNL